MYALLRDTKKAPLWSPLRKSAWRRLRRNKCTAFLHAASKSWKQSELPTLPSPGGVSGMLWRSCSMRTTFLGVVDNESGPIIERLRTSWRKEHECPITLIPHRSSRHPAGPHGPLRIPWRNRHGVCHQSVSFDFRPNPCTWLPSGRNVRIQNRFERRCDRGSHLPLYVHRT